jgi:hypothetical protein
MWPSPSSATSFVPSGEEAMPCQFLRYALVICVHVTPLSVDLYKNPPPPTSRAAANFVKSAEAVMPFQPLLPAPVSAVQVDPLSRDKYMYPVDEADL